MGRRLISALLCLVVAVALAACDAPAGSGLQVRAVGPLADLEPGDVVEIRVSGARPGQTVRLFQCAVVEACIPSGGATVVAGAEGAATARVTVVGTAYAQIFDGGFTLQREACRPARCVIGAATAFDGAGNPIDAVRAPVVLPMAGEQMTFSATPTEDLVGGESVRVSGRVRGAEGHRVRIARMAHFMPRNEESFTKVGRSVYATVRPDGTFSATFPLPVGTSTEPADCGNEHTTNCVITAWVVNEAGTHIDKSFGLPDVDLVYRR